MTARRWMIAGAVLAVALSFAPRVSSFSIDAGAFLDAPVLLGLGNDLHLGEPVHEHITADAVSHVSDDAAARLIRHLVRGNQNADGPTHKFDNAYHVNNATTANGAFRDSFDLVRHLIDAAVADARDNDEFWNPRHDTFQGILDDIADTLFGLGVNLACNIVRESACPQAQLLAKAAVVRADSIRLLANPMPDPHGAEKDMLLNLRTDLRTLLDPPGDKHYCRPLTTHCFAHLDRLLPDNDVFQADVRRLRRLEAEVRAYSAWQNLGHAFHTTQDFFAHANFVELLNDRNGPPCGSRGRPAICGEAIRGEPERTDPRLAPLLRELRAGFALNVKTLQASLGPKFSRLQTGFVDSVPHLSLTFCRETLPAGFDYCHWGFKEVPGLNKDDAADSDKDPSHLNHAYARKVAQFASEMLWEDFLRRADLLPPAPTDSKREALKRAKLARQRALRALIPVLMDDE
jgi:hypothetical protein